MQGKTSRATALLRFLLPAVLVLLVLPTMAQADSWALWDWSANIDGTTYNPPALPGSVDSSGFDFITGLGSLKFTFGASGAHYAGVYLSHYWERASNPGLDFSDAFATAVGLAPAGLTFQMGWPGVGSPSVFDNFAANTLDGSNTVSAWVAPPTACCSVATAMIQTFSVTAGFTDTLTFTVGTSNPGGFSLQETDHDSGQNIFLSATLREVPNGGADVPEPAAVWLLLTAGIGVAFAARRHRA